MKEPARTLLEAALVGTVALSAGLCANALNPDGLSLTRDHFRTATAEAILPRPAPLVPVAPAAPAVSDQAPAGATETPAEATAATSGFDAVEAPVAERLRARGLTPLTHAEARAAFEDPMYAAGATVFIDARGDDDYRAGHVPGAFQFDHYHPERHMDVVLPACRQALSVVVYCNGRECEDSELAALDLLGMGVDPRSVSVYVGGWTTWKAAGLPSESGARGGGQ